MIISTRRNVVWLAFSASAFCFFTRGAYAENWTDWHLVSKDPLVQVRWDKDEHDTVGAVSAIEFKADRNVTVRYTAYIKNMVPAKNGTRLVRWTERQVADGVSGTKDIPA
jgi:hypothetical protein